MHELQDFLDQVALVSDLDGLDAAEGSGRAPTNPVKLMTVHASKGLEFDHVFVAGVEENLLPHYHSLAFPEQVRQRRCVSRQV